jgi:hypothetical protein
VSAPLDAAALRLTAEQVRRLVERLIRIGETGLPGPDRVDDDDDAEDFAQEEAEAIAVETELRFAQALLAVDPDEEAFELLLRVAAGPGPDLPDAPDVRLLGGVLTRLVAVGEPSEAELREAAQSEVAEVRLRIAAGLDPERPAARAVLLRLAGDAHAGVRNVARQRLERAGHEIPWWVGLFDDDPFATVHPEVAARLVGPLGELAEALGDPFDPDRSLVEPLRALPDALVVALVPRLAASARDEGDELLRELLRREGGAAALLGMIESGVREQRFDLGIELDFDALPAARRAEIRTVFGPLAGRGWSPDRAHLVHWAAKCADGPDDAWSLVMAALQSGDVHMTSEVFVGAPVPGTRLAEAAAEALLAGCPEPWAKSRGVVERWLAKAPREWLRPLAEQAARADHDAIRRFGVAMLVGEAFDPARDGERDARVAALALDPRYAADFLTDLRLITATLPTLRDRVRRGEASVREAVALVLGLPRDAQPGRPEPPTAAEWAELRRLRAAAVRDDPEVARRHRYYLDVRDRGHPEDHALLQRLADEAVTEADVDRVMDLILVGYGLGRSPPDLEVTRSLRARFPDHPQVKHAWDFLTRLLADV